MKWKLYEKNYNIFKASDLLIQTDETAKQAFFLNTFILHNVPLLFVGPTGVGKTAVTNNFLIKLPKERYFHIYLMKFKNIAFSLSKTCLAS